MTLREQFEAEKGYDINDVIDDLYQVYIEWLEKKCTTNKFPTLKEALDVLDGFRNNGWGWMNPQSYWTGARHMYHHIKGKLK